MAERSIQTSHGVLELLNAARRTCLEGREPVTNDDWCQILNYVALNVEEPVVKVREIMRAVNRYAGGYWPQCYLQAVYQHQLAERRRLGLPLRPGEETPDG